MGVDPLSMALIAATTISAGSSIAGGYAASKAAKKEANMLNDQAATAEEQAQLEARRRAEDVRKFEKRQKLAFLKNGVTLEGSPLLVLEETLRLGQEEVDSIIRAGASQGRLLREKAGITKRQGRAAMIGGIGNAATSVIGTYAIGSQAGLWGKAGKGAGAGGGAYSGVSRITNPYR